MRATARFSAATACGATRLQAVMLPKRSFDRITAALPATGVAAAVPAMETAGTLLAAELGDTLVTWLARAVMFAAMVAAAEVLAGTLAMGDMDTEAVAVAFATADAAALALALAFAVAAMVEAGEAKEVIAAEAVGDAVDPGVLMGEAVVVTAGVTETAAETLAVGMGEAVAVALAAGEAAAVALAAGEAVAVALAMGEAVAVTFARVAFALMLGDTDGLVVAVTFAWAAGDAVMLALAGLDAMGVTVAFGESIAVGEKLGVGDTVALGDPARNLGAAWPCSGWLRCDALVVCASTEKYTLIAAMSSKIQRGRGMAEKPDLGTLYVRCAC